MAELDKHARTGEITSLRAKVKADPTLHVELLAAITKTLRAHSIVADKRIVSDLVIALPDELTSELSNAVVLPGGTNC